ncbi:MAG: 30S ribosomal protein S19 [Planctomycetes bacterium]|nr:30S ribosomal protein S19 [Planctomycetota bacterium]
MGRSVKKGPYVDERLLKRVVRQKETGSHDPLKTWARRCTIVPEFVNHTFMVHDGRRHQKVFVVEDMVGHKLGEFAATRTYRGHVGKKA